MKKISILWIAIIPWHFSCGEAECDEKFRQAEPLPIVELDHTMEICLKPTVMSTQFIINDDTAFFEIFDSTCAELPWIDFTQNTFIGYKTEGAGCSISFERKLISQEVGYKLMLLVTTSGSCKKLGISYNWVLVNKIADAALVEFEVIRC